MLPITGYLDRLSAQPGEHIAVKVSSCLGKNYYADLVRIVHGDPNPAGPGLKLVEVPNRIFAGTYPSREQPIHLGSYGRVEGPLPVAEGEPFTVRALVWPTLPQDGRQVLIATGDDQGSGFALGIGPDGGWLDIGRRHGESVSLCTNHSLVERTWYVVWASFDPGTGKMRLGQAPFRPSGYGDERQVISLSISDVSIATKGPLLIGARPGARPSQHLNGRIEDPAVFAFAAEDDVALEALDPRTSASPPLAWWDFAVGIDTQSIVDRGPFGLAGRLINLPTRAVRGARWTGQEMCWRHSPEHYACIHFHDDDIGDCRWETDFIVAIPVGMASGVYGVRLRCDGNEDILPFYVRSRRGEATARVLFLASTFTYQAYFNHARGNADGAYMARVADWNAYPHNPDHHPEYGRSTYNRHRDRSGICYSSRLRPVLTMRPGFLTFNDPRGSGLRHFSADTHLLDWLEAKGITFDVATDEDLDDEGLELLKPYAVVLTGSHPEYHTPRMLDALLAYRDQGGRLVYLGGNGFYWRIARSPALPGVIEVRRGEGGIRAWAAEAGEYYHSVDGAYGGLWRRNGRDPQQLCGIGFSAQGLFEGSYYRRMPASSDPRAAWIFEGVADEILGDFGLSGGGAAGFELDRADVRLGTPRHALMLARSERHTPSYVVVPEELLSHIATLSGEEPAALIRGEIVFFETPRGGAVFSVGSITFCGSLSHNGYNNNISRLLENVVRRFSDPTPFPPTSLT
jgi:N,N-dimethylformamidase